MAKKKPGRAKGKPPAGPKRKSAKMDVVEDCDEDVASSLSELTPEECQQALEDLADLCPDAMGQWLIDHIDKLSPEVRAALLSEMEKHGPATE
jgi:hypothetical protein